MSVSKKSLKAQTNFDKQNAISASIILNDIEKHGGEKSMQVQWARRWKANQEAINGSTRTS